MFWVVWVVWVVWMFGWFGWFLDDLVVLMDFCNLVNF